MLTLWRGELVFDCPGVFAGRRRVSGQGGALPAPHLAMARGSTKRACACAVVVFVCMIACHARQELPPELLKKLLYEVGWVAGLFSAPGLMGRAGGGGVEAQSKPHKAWRGVHVPNFGAHCSLPASNCAAGTQLHAPGTGQGGRRTGARALPNAPGGCGGNELARPAFAQLGPAPRAHRFLRRMGC